MATAKKTNNPATIDKAGVHDDGRSTEAASSRALGAVPVGEPTPPREGPELPVIAPIPGSDYTADGEAEQPVDAPAKKAKTADYTCPSCGKTTALETADLKGQGPPTCNECGVRLTKD